MPATTPAIVLVDRQGEGWTCKAEGKEKLAGHRRRSGGGGGGRDGRKMARAFCGSPTHTKPIKPAVKAFFQHDSLCTRPPATHLV